ncbi:hypothetical protein GPECTOR_33g586 [Gonium pectorale]|uniref:PGG domain-containing protein n=1 Tax=Gonium pectorale TaxID=33097 RepID=A0A150GCY6_GONPE|nr:hypothetical protein GPECTOR_33g586 [Gonium pectorale]|eukprot:KXZ47704.1 hypothetical protein GPECTOR_33g586 [Gonium pectorale]
MGNQISATDLQEGAPALQARLRSGANPNKHLHFWEPTGLLPPNCPCTPLGYAILAKDTDMLDALLAAGADPSRSVGLPRGFNFSPLHLAAAVGNDDAISRLLAAGANRMSRLAPLRWISHPLSMLRGPDAPLPAELEGLWGASYFTTGDTPLHVAAHTGRVPAIQVLLKEEDNTLRSEQRGEARSHTPDGPTVGEHKHRHKRVLRKHKHLLHKVANAPNMHNETPLYCAVRARKDEAVYKLLANPAVDVNAGGALFGAIETQDECLVRALLHAGARVDKNMRNAAGQSPLAFCIYRYSLWFRNRADLARQLIKAGALVDRSMVQYAQERGWQKVEGALLWGWEWQQSQLQRQPTQPLQLEQRKAGGGAGTQQAVIKKGGGGSSDREGTKDGGGDSKAAAAALELPRLRPPLRLGAGRDCWVEKFFKGVITCVIVIPMHSAVGVALWAALYTKNGASGVPSLLPLFYWLAGYFIIIFWYQT